MILLSIITILKRKSPIRQCQIAKPYCSQTAISYRVNLLRFYWFDEGLTLPFPNIVRVHSWFVLWLRGKYTLISKLIANLMGEKFKFLDILGELVFGSGDVLPIVFGFHWRVWFKYIMGQNISWKIFNISTCLATSNSANLFLHPWTLVWLRRGFVVLRMLFAIS